MIYNEKNPFAESPLCWIGGGVNRTGNLNYCCSNYLFFLYGKPVLYRFFVFYSLKTKWNRYLEIV